jgi:hypothetical protein
MATSRRRENEEVRMGVLVRALLVCAVIAGLGIGYVRQNAQQLEYGRQITELERYRDRLMQTVSIQRGTIATLESRPELLARVQRFKLGLELATPGQRLFVPVSAMPPMAGRDDRSLVVRPGGVAAPIGVLTSGDRSL